MKESSCEDVLMAQMAVADGEESRVSNQQITAHIAACANCQHELKQLQALDRVLTGQTLSEPRVHLWPAIENRIAKPSRTVRGWQPFALIGLLLVVYKLMEMLPARDPSIAFKLVPLVIIAFLFVLIKENPFRINTALLLEK